MSEFGTNPLDTWSNSIAVGNQGERKLARALEKHMFWTVTCNNAVNKRAIDLTATTGGLKPKVFPLEAKYLTSAYPSSPTPSGLQAAEHLTLDVVNIESYSDDTVIMMVTDYTPKHDTKGVFCVTAGNVQRILKAMPNRAYSRSQRTMKDKIRKVGISTEDCTLLIFPGLTQEETVDACKELQV